MAWVRKAPSGRYRAEYRDPFGRKRSRSFDRKADAQRWLAEQTTSIARGSYVDPSGGKSDSTRGPTDGSRAPCTFANRAALVSRRLST